MACYIHLNPVRAGLVDRPDNWKFSNFVDFAGAEGSVASCEEKTAKEVTSIPALWHGYAAFVSELLNEGQTQKAWEKKLESHIKGFLK